MVNTEFVLLSWNSAMQGCRSPLVVKLADSQKEKEMKRLQQMQAQLLNGAGAVGLGALSQQYLAVSVTSRILAGRLIGACICRVAKWGSCPSLEFTASFVNSVKF